MQREKDAEEQLDQMAKVMLAHSSTSRFTDTIERIREGSSSDSLVSWMNAISISLPIRICPMRMTERERSDCAIDLIDLRPRPHPHTRALLDRAHASNDFDEQKR